MIQLVKQSQDGHALNQLMELIQFVRPLVEMEQLKVQKLVMTIMFFQEMGAPPHAK